MKYREYIEQDETIANLVLGGSSQCTTRRIGIVRVSMDVSVNKLHELFKKRKLFPLTSCIEYNGTGYILKYLCWSPNFRHVDRGTSVPSYTVGKKEA